MAAAEFESWPSLAWRRLNECWQMFYSRKTNPDEEHSDLAWNYRLPWPQVLGAETSRLQSPKEKMKTVETIRERARRECSTKKLAVQWSGRSRARLEYYPNRFTFSIFSVLRDWGPFMWSNISLSKVLLEFYSAAMGRVKWWTEGNTDGPYVKWHESLLLLWGIKESYFFITMNGFAVNVVV